MYSIIVNINKNNTGINCVNNIRLNVIYFTTTIFLSFSVYFLYWSDFNVCMIIFIFLKLSTCYSNFIRFINLVSKAQENKSENHKWPYNVSCNFYTYSVITECLLLFQFFKKSWNFHISCRPDEKQATELCKEWFNGTDDMGPRRVSIS